MIQVNHKNNCYNFLCSHACSTVYKRPDATTRSLLTSTVLFTITLSYYYTLLYTCIVILWHLRVKGWWRGQIFYFYFQVTKELLDRKTPEVNCICLGSLSLMNLIVQGLSIQVLGRSNYYKRVNSLSKTSISKSLDWCYCIIATLLIPWL